MFKKLKQHWHVNNLNMVLILTTFALGGSLCGYAGRKALLLLHLHSGFIWAITYLVLVFLLWPVCVILISFPLGQFRFFKRYIGKIWDKLSGRHRVRIAILASGAGSNAQKIIGHFRESPLARVVLIGCNNPGAGVLSIAKDEKINSLLLNKEIFFDGEHYLGEFRKNKIDLIVLAGFLWKVPRELIQAYPGKIINIHPALLPKYGGKGMYGLFVHEAVIRNKEKESGITIHYVDELYDHGKIIFQAKCRVDENETPGSLAKKIHVLEHENYPAVIEKLTRKG